MLVQARVEKPTSPRVQGCYSFDMNSRWNVALLGVVMVGGFASCLSGTAPAGEIKPQIEPSLAVSATTKLDPSLKPRLLGRYFTLNIGQRDINKQKFTKLEPSYDDLKYEPNGSSFVGFEGWDVLEQRKGWNVDPSRSDYVRLTLTRDAKLAVLSPNRFGWMDGAWTEGAAVDGRNKSFTKAFTKGEVSLGAPNKDGDAYTVLVAESDGKASMYPSAPAGNTQPKPNERCPSWVDKTYQVEGPNGKMYDSWHPQIDPVFWCNFEHEHGSDPALVGLPGFWLGYVAEVNKSQAEIHEGFKGFAIRDETKQRGWYFNVHAETHDLHRVCTRTHTVVVIVTDLTKPYPSNVLAAVHFKGDFGASQTNRDVAGQRVTLSPPANLPPLGACEDQKTIAAQVSNDKGEVQLFKRIRVNSIPGEKDDNGGYENWRGGLTSELGLTVADWFGGSIRPAFNIDIRNPRTTCTNLQCTNTITNQDNHGDERTFFVPNLKLEYTRLIEEKDTKFGAKDGVFYTDKFGKVTLAEGPDSFKQFITPGLKLDGPDGGFHTEDAWRGLYVDSDLAGVPRLELDGSLGLN